MANEDYPGAGWPPPAPYGYGYPPPGYGPPQQGYYPPPQGMPYPQQPQQSDMSGQLLGVIVPLLTTIPALRASKTNTANIITALTQMPALTPIVNPPTSADFNNLQTYANNLRTNMLAAVNNDQTVFSQIAQGLMMQMLMGAVQNSNGMGGTNMMMMLVLVMALGGSFGA